jgi:hypothetical protein
LYGIKFYDAETQVYKWNGMALMGAGSTGSFWGASVFNSSFDLCAYNGYQPG